jgi:Zn-dependent protease with chaperone function
MKGIAIMSYRTISACAYAVVVVPLLGSGCAMTQQLLQPAPAATANAAALNPSSNGDSASRPAAAEPTRPAGAAASAVTAKPGAEVGRTASVQLGQKVLPIASQEIDARCGRVVAPFNLTNNAAELGEVVVENTKNSLSKWADDKLQGKGSKQTAKNDAKRTKELSVAEAKSRASRMNWLPMDTEVMYGQYQHDQLAKDGQVLDADSRIGKQVYPKLQALAKPMLESLGETHPYGFKFFVRSRDGENAMSLPGGFVYVDKELLTNPVLQKKAAFALAHEIAHILQRHETRNAQARIIDTAVLGGGVANLVKTMRMAEQKNTAIITATLAGKMLFTRHFAIQELQSDACATRVLNNAMGNRKELVDTLQAFVDRLPKPVPEPESASAAVKPVAHSPGQAQITRSPAAARNQDAIVKLVTSPINQHPTTTERVAALRQVLAAIQAGK